MAISSITRLQQTNSAGGVGRRGERARWPERERGEGGGGGGLAIKEIDVARS